MARYQWRLTPKNDHRAHALSSELGVSAVVASLLIDRGLEDVDEARRFLEPDYEHLADPLLLPDARLAVQRLVRAVKDKETIVVFGDYDCDGVTSTALWKDCLERLGAKVAAILPSRSVDGYGLNASSIASAREIGSKLIITCDCGSTAHQVIEQAASYGIETIVTDHHQLGDDLPKALAVVNPHRSDSQYPFEHLSGVGVSFRLAEALAVELGLPIHNFRKRYIDLAAIGTVADVMPLIGENRIFAKAGTEALSNPDRPGLRALKRLAGLSSAVDPRAIGFVIGPRLNAAGRMDHASLALQLLLTKDEEESLALAERLERQNSDRQHIQQEALAEAEAQIEQGSLMNEKAILVKADGWHMGIIGIVAGRLANKHARPVFVMTSDADGRDYVGSIRSGGRVDIRPILEALSPLCTKSGGHPHAGGFSIQGDKIDEFAERLRETSIALIPDEALVPILNVDGEVDAPDANLRLLEELDRMAPFGHGNERPTFVSRDVRVLASRPTKDDKHLQLSLIGDRGIPIKGIAFGMGSIPIAAGSTVDVAYQLELDEFNGNRNAQWNIQDVEIKS